MDKQMVGWVDVWMNSQMVGGWAKDVWMNSQMGRWMGNEQIDG